MKDIKVCRPLSLLSHMHKLFTRTLQNDCNRFLVKINQENRPGLENITVDHLQAINQQIEISN